LLFNSVIQLLSPNSEIIQNNNSPLIDSISLLEDNKFIKLSNLDNNKSEPFNNLDNYYPLQNIIKNKSNINKDTILYIQLLKEA